jgi:hypothetical protein
MVILSRKAPKLPWTKKTHLMLHQLLFPLTQLPHTPDIIPQDSTPSS